MSRRQARPAAGHPVLPTDAGHTWGCLRRGGEEASRTDSHAVVLYSGSVGEAVMTRPRRRHCSCPRTLPSDAASPPSPRLRPQRRHGTARGVMRRRGTTSSAPHVTAGRGCCRSLLQCFGGGPGKGGGSRGSGSWRVGRGFNVGHAGRSGAVPVKACANSAMPRQSSRRLRLLGH